MKIQVRIFTLILCLLLGSSAFAHNGGGFHGGGGGHNGGPVHNDGNYHNGYNNHYHNHYNSNGWYGGGTWFDDGVNDESTNVVIGVPDGGYYDPACQTVQTCNSDGECVTQQNCN